MVRRINDSISGGRRTHCAPRCSQVEVFLKRLTRLEAACRSTRVHSSRPCACLFWWPRALNAKFGPGINGRSMNEAAFCQSASTPILKKSSEVWSRAMIVSYGSGAPIFCQTLALSDVQTRRTRRKIWKALAPKARAVCRCHQTYRRAFAISICLSSICAASWVNEFDSRVTYGKEVVCQQLRQSNLLTSSCGKNLFVNPLSCQSIMSPRRQLRLVVGTSASSGRRMVIRRQRA